MFGAESGVNYFTLVHEKVLNVWFPYRRRGLAMPYSLLSWHTGALGRPCWSTWMMKPTMPRRMLRRYVLI